MSESYARLNPIRVLFHINRDKEWQKLTAKSLLKIGKDELADVNLSKSGDEGPEELTVRRLMQDLDRPPEDKIWKDKGLGRAELMSRDHDFA